MRASPTSKNLSLSLRMGSAPTASVVVVITGVVVELVASASIYSKPNLTWVRRPMVP